MCNWLRQSTAVDIKMGPFLDSVDGNAQETGLTITQPDIRLAKNGGAWAQKNAAQTLSHEEAGWYEVSLDATDTNTLGILIVAIHESGALPVWDKFMVVPANVYDSLIDPGTDFLQVDVAQWIGTAPATPTVAGVPEVDLTHIGGVAQSATDLKDFADEGYDPATNKVQGVVLTDTLTTYTGNTPQTGDSFARLGAPAGASVSADIAAIEGQTDDIGVAGAGLTAIPWNAAWDAEVQSEVEDGIVAKNLDKLILASGTADSGSTTTMVDAARTEGDADYWKGRIILFTSGVIAGQCAIITDFNAGTDTFTFAPALTQAVATQTYVILPGISVWDDVMAEHLIVGSTGEKLNAAGGAGDPWTTALPGAYGAGSAGKIVGDNLNATVSSRATQTSVDAIDDFVDTEIADIQARLPAALVSGRMDSHVGSIADAVLTAAKFAAGAFDAVWSVATRLLTAGTNIVLAKGVGVTGLNDLDAAGVRSAVGLAAANLDTQLSTIDDFLDTEIAAIKAKTDNLPASFPIKKNAALNNFMFKMKLTSDHLSPATGVTVTATRSIDGAAFAACANSATEVSDGFFKINLATTDLNGDVITLRFTAPTADPTEITLVAVS